ncbi:hypothetical protein Dsin_013497 [Dipteronia sinensis]|uniref:RRM domain-containing protein n=1 Tax=Dipteronia sinensis TaxID=43782 RepID=A0AAE0AK51_9ROSI|nr:hypothetical protein Dsin_013497 [Dipteronia sinensis]
MSRHEGNRDFRENLFSIFVDNLNSKVDVACLWEIFKSFGRVRDVFLSSKSTSRGKCFSFIRFESLEEARRVAENVNGKSVYGWLINSKVAAFGWKNRRKDSEKTEEVIYPHFVSHTDKEMGRRLVNGKLLSNGMKMDLVSTHQVMNKCGKISEVGGDVSRFFGFSKLKLENVVGKKPVKDDGPRKSNDMNGLILKGDNDTNDSSPSSYDMSSSFDAYEGHESEDVEQLSGGISKMRRKRKIMVPLKRQNMTLRSSNAYEKKKQQFFESNTKMVWNLEEEVVKVFEKGIALGFNFYGRKKELLEIIDSRKEVNDNRFRDLVRRLVLKHKVMG